MVVWMPKDVVDSANHSSEALLMLPNSKIEVSVFSWRADHDYVPASVLHLLAEGMRTIVDTECEQGTEKLNALTALTTMDTSGKVN